MPVFTMTMERYFASCDTCGKEVDITENPRDLSHFYASYPRQRPQLPEEWITSETGMETYCSQEHQLLAMKKKLEQ